MSTESHSDTPSGPATEIVAELAVLPPHPLSPDSGAGSTTRGPGRFGVPTRLLLALLIANGAVWMTYFTPILVAVPAKIKLLAPENYTSYYSLTLTLASVAGIIAGPIAGNLSDRSTSRHGRRRPWLLGSMAIGLVGTLVMGFAPSVLVFILGAIVSQVGFGATTATQLSLLPEHVPAARRGTVGGLLGVSTAVATIIGVLITGTLTGAGHLPLAFVAISVIGAAGILFLVRTVPDAVNSSTRTRVGLLEVLKSFYINPRRHPDFAWGWLSRFMLYLSLAGVLNYQLFYLSDQLGIPSARAEAVFIPLGTAVQVVTTVIGAVIGGPLSDRFGRRKPFVAFAAALAGVGLVCLALATSIPLFLVGIFMIGLAGGIYASVDIALMTAVLPNDIRDAGKNLGVLNIANSLPNTLAPAIAPLLLSIGLVSAVAETDGRNYTMLFLGSAVFALVSVFSVLKVRSVR